MGLQLKDGNQTDTSQEPKGVNPWDAPKKEVNPWDVPEKEEVDLKIEEPVMLYNTSMAELKAQQKESNPLVGAFFKIIIALVVCGIIMFVGKQIVSVVRPEGQDITNLLNKKESEIAAELGLTFVDDPAMERNIYQYSKSKATVKSAGDLGIVYLEGRKIGVHIPSKQYKIFNIQIGAGEVEMYNRTTYPFDSSLVLLDTMGDKATVYIYYNEQRNDCIVYYINNTTNRIVHMTYFNDYKKITETLESSAD